jgi:hypothetical protein
MLKTIIEYSHTPVDVSTLPNHVNLCLIFSLALSLFNSILFIIVVHGNNKINLLPLGSCNLQKFILITATLKYHLTSTITSVHLVSMSDTTQSK